MGQRQLLNEDRCVATPAETALRIKLVTEMDLLRLKTIARLHARGLPADVGWTDLLQEAFARALDGSRRRPEGLPIVVFLAGVMRSIKSEYWRRGQRESHYAQTSRADPSSILIHGAEPRDPAPDPERSLIAVQEIAAIDRLFADDATALQIMAGLSEGLSADAIQLAFGMTKTDYDSARKRMRRVLLREGLTCRHP
jgi:RNA polymerase sigma-70 factor (ECF subfamily)